jgi:hypothetical protein
MLNAMQQAFVNAVSKPGANMTLVKKVIDAADRSDRAQKAIRILRRLLPAD